MNKRSILNSLWSFWLGISLGICGFTLFTWQFYFIALPTIALVVIAFKLKSIGEKYV